MAGKPTLVLDANAVLDRDLRRWIQRYPTRKVLPAVAFTELGVHYARRGELGRLTAWLQGAGIEVEWFRAQEATTAAQTGAATGDFAAKARDHMVGAHAAAPGRVLVTNNTRDFTFVEHVLTTAEATARLG